ncbi:RES family NAD+ phosphorylase [Luteibacter aegosomatis]|uniref:RES family NAD+ phosphorylase n=1 Tax=Luteibacter aegosomatis TaxID=2911537 RepID=UPI001FFAC175|nr:RES family NAD+ phosphorylase [Luteibacter aegosomatis]UPG85855.1 RES family NAD+ phosphorylase [Luteibacter aegosomatis]
MSALPPQRRIRWTQAYRIVPSRFPPVGLFDRIADPGDIDAVMAVESLTNPRLRDEMGALSLVPPSRRVSGPGTTPIMAAFAHIPPEGSRFSDGHWGVFYAAHSIPTAIEETVFHREAFLAATKEPPTDVQVRCYKTAVSARLHDIRGGWGAEHDPDSYAASVRLARSLRDDGSNGIVYDSARHPGGECVAAFYPDVVAPCVQAEHFIYRWNGKRIEAVLKVTAVERGLPPKA